jgi:glycosyltransferase involved in cell wall biosynthesis
MKLLLYSHFFPPSIGGVETIVLSIARGLAELRESNGAPQFEITLVTQTPAGNYHDSANPFRTIRQPGLLNLWRLVRTADVVHVAGPAFAPLLLSLLAGKPFVVEHHGFHTICPNGQLLIEPAGVPCPGHFMAGRQTECLRCNSSQGWIATYRLWLLTFVRRFLSAQAAANISPTQWLGDLLLLPRTVSVPHGLEAGEAISRPAPLPNTPVIAFLGRLVTTKGVRVLLEAARILRDQNRLFELLIIGDGPERRSLEQFVHDAQMDAQVCFVGRLSGPQVEASLARASAVVVPSLGGEVFGLVVAENMLRGLPLFHRLTELAREESSESATPGFLRAIHRRTYYAFLTALEKRIYSNPRVSIAAVSQRTASLLEKYFGRHDVRVIPNGVDTVQFSPAMRLARRDRARALRQFHETDFVFLVIGNDWRNKGLPAILEAMQKLSSTPARLLVVGNDSSTPFRAMAENLGIHDRCVWEPPTADILDAYAAADIYVSPSREDSFGMPVAEAMACGLPVITSKFAGVPSLIDDGIDGFVLPDPHDVESLAKLIRMLYEKPELRSRMGQAAAKIILEWTWERNAGAIWQLLQEASAKKPSS